MPPQELNLPELKVNVFPGGFNWGLYAGIEKGFFAQQGLRIQILGTPNSVTQMTEFAEGKFDIAMTAVDNIVAYCEGQGEAPIGAQPEFFAFMGSDSGFLSLVCAPDISTIADLAGKVLSVDALTTGYAFVLYEILRRNGMDRNAYELQRRGGMIQRMNSLLERNEKATLLSAPYNLIAKGRGQKQLVTATSVLGAYQGNVAAARRSWAEKNGDKIVAFIRAYHASIAWLYQPANRAAAIDLLVRNVAGMSHDVAEASYGELLAPEGGFFRDCKIDMAGLQCVLDLRSRYAEPKKTLTDPMTYCDASYYQRASSAF
jgi:ABC-type nitrate/sulfonate/bicarbonate transport system substrate-binding protein